LPPYPQGRSPLYSLDRRLAEPLNQSGCSSKEKEKSFRCQASNPSHPVHNLVIILTAPERYEETH